MNWLDALNQYTQLINFALLLGIIGYLFQLSGMYRANVKEQVNTLQERLKKAESESPLAAAESLKKRVQITEEEIKRLQQDRDEEAKHIKEELGRLKEFSELLEKRSRGLEEIAKALDEREESLNNRSALVDEREEFLLGELEESSEKFNESARVAYDRLATTIEGLNMIERLIPQVKIIGELRATIAQMGNQYLEIFESYEELEKAKEEFRNIREKIKNNELDELTDDNNIMTN